MPPTSTLPVFAIPVPEAAELGAPIDTLDRIHAIEGMGQALRMSRTAGAEFKKEFLGTGTPVHVSTHDLVTLPYPTSFGLWRAPLSPAPMLFITTRLVIVRWQEGKRTRTLLWEPSDVELDRNTPYFASLREKTPGPIQKLGVSEYATVAQRLAQAGIDPAEVDYLGFDHLHTQDVRRLIGTTRPQADISPDAPVPALFPNAKLVVQRRELESMVDLHPLQRPWYQPETFVDLDPDRILPIDGDRLLAPGVAIVRTPGHARGNQTLVLNTDTGVWAMSENVIAAECLTPEHSRIPGVAGWAQRWQQEIILNANVLETTAQQYNFCVLEKSPVDRSQADSRFLQFFPTSELTAHWLAPGTWPTFTHKSLRHGTAKP
ncbi:hypothetical protein [Nocardia crassostreae]|uniref:hypothetical protein n=1 Tax=Nocardia crassostreae TaxID=53428 RepID=UPI000B2492EF|nr:hypothetical protein [Nocardia crassostreae]